MPALSHLVLTQAPEREFGFVAAVPPGLRPRCSRRRCAAPRTTYGVAAGGARGRRVADPADGHGLHAAPRRGLDRDQRRAAAQRLARRLGRGRGHDREAAPASSPRWRPSSPRPAAPRSPRTRWAPSRATSSSCSSRSRQWKTGRTKARARRGDERRARHDPGPAGLVLAADRPARQRADLRRQERPGGQGLRPRPDGPQGVRRPGGGRDRRRSTGARDVKVEQVSGMAEVEVGLDREAMARYALNVGDVNELLEAAFAGPRRQHLRRGGAPLRRARALPRGGTAGPPGRRALLVPTPAGAARAARPDRVGRGRSRGRCRSAARTGCGGSSSRPTCAAATSAASSATSRTRLAPLWQRAAGRATSSSTAASSRTSSAPCASSPSSCRSCCCSSCSCSTRRSAAPRNAALVLLNLPFALVGGVVAAVAFRMTLSVSAAVAFIVLLGIAVQNGVVLVAFFTQLRERGADGRRGGGRGVPAALQAAGDDRADQLHRPPADGLRHRLRRRHPEAAGGHRHGRHRHLDAADAARAAGAVPRVRGRGRAEEARGPRRAAPTGRTVGSSRGAVRQAARRGR